MFIIHSWTAKLEEFWKMYLYIANVFLLSCAWPLLKGMLKHSVICITPEKGKSWDKWSSLPHAESVYPLGSQQKESSRFIKSSNFSLAMHMEDSFSLQSNLSVAKLSLCFKGTCVNFSAVFHEPQSTSSVEVLNWEGNPCVAKVRRWRIVKRKARRKWNAKRCRPE